MKYDEEIKRAKGEVIEEKRQAWIREYGGKCPDGIIPEPPKEAITPKSWFITQWDTGYIVADLDELMKLPKTRRDKIFKLGGIG